jgi:hypothetical protein
VFIPGANAKTGGESAFLGLNRPVEALISPSILCRHNARPMLVLGDEIENPVAIS